MLKLGKSLDCTIIIAQEGTKETFVNAFQKLDVHYMYHAAYIFLSAMSGTKKGKIKPKYLDKQELL